MAPASSSASVLNLSIPLLDNASARSHDFGGGAASSSSIRQLQAPAGCYMRHTMCFMTFLMITCAYATPPFLHYIIVTLGQVLPENKPQRGHTRHE